jgi:hypothetical protein
MTDVTRMIPGSTGSSGEHVKAYKATNPQFNPLYQVVNQQNAAIQPQSSADKATVQPDGIPGKSPVTSATFNGLDLYANKDQITEASMVATQDFNGKRLPKTFIDMYNKSKNHPGNNKLIGSDD